MLGLQICKDAYETDQQGGNAQWKIRQVGTKDQPENEGES